jgi:hypothetical protein
VWGKGLRCGKCGMAVHGKCELKVRVFVLFLFSSVFGKVERWSAKLPPSQVPAGCAARPGAGVVRSKSKKHGGSSVGSVSSVASPPPTTSTSFLPPILPLYYIPVFTLCGATDASFTPLNTSTSSLPPPRRTMPAPGSDSNLPPMPSATSASSGGGGGEQRAVLLYDYAATSELELSVSGTFFLLSPSASTASRRAGNDWSSLYVQKATRSQSSHLKTPPAGRRCETKTGGKGWFRGATSSSLRRSPVHR